MQQLAHHLQLSPVSVSLIVVPHTIPARVILADNDRPAARVVLLRDEPCRTHTALALLLTTTTPAVCCCPASLPKATFDS